MEDIKLLNLEDTVGYLVDRAELASIGATLKGRVDNYDSLPVGTVGDVYAVGTTKPYSYYAYTDTGWLDIGTWPLAGPKGVPGDQGPQGPAGPIGPKGDKGNQGIAGPAGGGVGIDRITKLELAAGTPSIAYDKTKGATQVKQGTITAAGTNYDISVNDKLPIIPGKNININTNTANDALVIGADIAVTSVNGKTGDVSLTIPTSTSQLVNDAEFITAEYHDNTKQDTLVSGTNIKTINNQSLLGSGNITISGGGGGSGTDTGFANVREIQAADNQTTYNPDTKEYIISSGNADIFYKDGTKTTIPYVQEIGLMAGDNITFTEEFVDNANYRVKINATGGGSSNVQQTNGFYPYKGVVYANPVVGNTYGYQDNKTDYYLTECSYRQGQMIVDQNGVIYKVTATSMCECVYIPQSGGGGGGSSSLYQHTITYSSDKFNERDDFGGADVTGSFSISFYSTHGHFESPSDFWAWLIGRGSINVCDGQLWGNMGGGTPFTRITVFGNTDAEKYITFEAYGGSGEWNSIQYFLKNPDATGLTDTIIDGVHDM